MRTASAILLFAVSAVSPVFAQDVPPGVRLTPEQSQYRVGNRMDILRDRDGNLKFRDVRRRRDGWFRTSAEVPNFVMDPAVFWLRLKIENPATVSRNILLDVAYPLHDFVDAYIPDATGKYRITLTGDQRSIRTRAIRGRTFLFPVNIPAGTASIVYLRISSVDGLQEPMPLILWDRKAFTAHDATETARMAMLIGAIFVIGLYNLLMFSSLREPSYLFNGLFLIALGLFQLAYKGFTPLLLFPDHGYWNNQFHPHIIALCLLFLVLFARYFLQTHALSRKWDNAMRGLTLLLLVFQLLPPLLPMLISIWIAAGLAVLGTTCIAALSVSAILQGHRAARWFLLTYAASFLGSITLILKGLSILPSNFFTENAFLFSGVLSALLLSLALADRMKQMREEKDQARKDALDIERKANLELSRKNEELKRLDRLKDDFLANTSHELRTPLNGIIGITESLLEGAAGPLSANTRGDLQLVASGGRRLAGLVNDILDFSKLRHGDISLQRRAVDPSSIIKVVLALSRHLIQERDLDFVYDAVPTPLVYADENRLEQILHNLIGNAVKFTHRGSVSVTTRSLDEQLEITVSDTGVGIPQEKHDVIFDSFTQGDGSVSREFSGTGLGLSITRKLIELHGGSIRVDSAPGEGARFSFTLPLADQAQLPASVEDKPADERLVSKVIPGDAGSPTAFAQAPLPELMLSASHPGIIRTLIVDDDPINLKVLRNHLALLGHEVVQAVNGHEALKLLEDDHGFDLLLLDVMMPGLSGYEVCRILREEKSESELPVIMLTARNRVVDLVTGLDSGANDYLTKPFDPRELNARVRTMLKLKEAARSQSELAGLNAGLELAREIQQSLLPLELPVVPGLDMAVQYRSMENVGGDYYDLIVEDGKVGALMADVSGHGVPAALIVSIVKIAFWFHRRTPAEPVRIFEGMNRALLGNIGNEFVTACYVCVDPERRVLYTSNAGHPALLVWKKSAGELAALRPAGRILGFLPDPVFEIAEHQLSPGDRIILYTDGVLEAGNAENKQFEETRLHRFIQEHEELPPDDFARTLVDTVTNWSGGRENVEDDIAVLVIDFEPDK